MKLTQKVLLLLCCAIIGTFSVTTAIELGRLRHEFTEQLESSHKIILANLMSNLAGAMFNIDEQRIRSQLVSSFEFGDIRSILLVDDKARISFHYQRTADSRDPAEYDPQAPSEWSEQVLEKFREPSVGFTSATSSLIEDLGIINGDTHRYRATLWYVEDDRQTFVGHIIFDFSTSLIAQKVQSAAWAKILSALAIAAILVFGIFFFLRISVLSRLESLNHAANKIRRRDFTTKIRLAGSDEIAILGNSFQEMADEVQTYQLGLEDKVNQRTIELQKSRDKIKLVFDTIDQGIVSIDSDFKVDAQFSKNTLAILNVTEAELISQGLDRCFFSKLEMTSDRRDLMHAAVNSIIDSDEIALLSNSIHLPDESMLIGVNGVKRHFRFDWYPIINIEKGITSRLLLSISDLTREKLEEEHKRQLSIRNQQLVSLVSASRLHAFSTIDSFLSHAHVDLNALASRKSVSESLIALHTIKGEARTLGFNDLSSAIHDAESAVKAADRPHIDHCIHQAVELAKGYHDLLTQIFVGKNKVKSSLIQCVTDLYQDLEQRLESVNRRFESFEVIDHYGCWDSHFIDEVIAPCLMHSLNNSVDHGYLLPDEKQKELRLIHLCIKAFRSESDLTIEISDRGMGINENTVLERARKLGIKTEGLQANEIIFLPEFSTTEKISQTSGRGVGMAAIKQIVTEHGGKIGFESQYREGTTLSLIFPLSKTQVWAKVS